MDASLNPQRIARVTGVLYLVIIVLGLFSEVGVRGSVLVPGDALATAENLAASETLFRIGFVSDLVVFLSDVAVAVLLYVLLRPVSHMVALMAAAFRLTGTAIYGANLLNHMAPLLLLAGSGSGAGLDGEQSAALALFFLELHGHGYDLGLVFFGIHCLALGYLLYRSELFPRTLGVLMVLACIGYLVGSGTRFLAPELSSAVTPVYLAPLVGEFALTLWLLVRGVRKV